VLRFIMGGGSPRRTAVSEIMKRDPATVTPETPTIEALRMMRRLGVGCLPVIQNERLFGIITEEDFMDLAAKLLEEQLGTNDQLALSFDMEPREEDMSGKVQMPAKGDLSGKIEAAKPEAKAEAKTEAPSSAKPADA
jgi:CBS-domain-containing membrane protein